MGLCGLRTESCTRNTSGTKAVLGPPPPTFCETPTGQNQVKIRSRPDCDPISTRFRPDFDPTPKTVFWGTRFQTRCRERTRFPTRFRPDFDPTLIWFWAATFNESLGSGLSLPEGSVDPMSGVLSRCAWVAQAVVCSMESTRQGNSISAKV